MILITVELATLVDGCIVIASACIKVQPYERKKEKL